MPRHILSLYIFAINGLHCAVYQVLQMQFIRIVGRLCVTSPVVALECSTPPAHHEMERVNMQKVPHSLSLYLVRNEIFMDRVRVPRHSRHRLNRSGQLDCIFHALSAVRAPENLFFFFPILRVVPFSHIRCAQPETLFLGTHCDGGVGVCRVFIGRLGASHTENGTFLNRPRKHHSVPIVRSWTMGERAKNQTERNFQHLESENASIWRNTFEHMCKIISVPQSMILIRSNSHISSIWLLSRLWD